VVRKKTGRTYHLGTFLRLFLLLREDMMDGGKEAAGDKEESDVASYDDGDVLTCRGVRLWHIAYSSRKKE
jgi:hypothetical protein